ncbi:helix-turn-helix domain-containing protein [Dactylosporangium sp. McL0621]|uniref:helix-turn-helix domain-containing protein n=1 Tax=Dactylosporangium sp. McL0621 TaxID=3415678 RepID=UPI003CE96B58
MSAAVKNALRASHDLPKTERLVLVAIAAHANADGDAWPSVATIADYVGCSTRTVQRALSKLVELGRLVVRKVASIATRVYRLVTGGGDTDAAGGDISARGVTDSAAGGDTQAVTRSSEDHLEEKKRAPRDWRRFLPKGKKSAEAGPPFPERRGAALPPPSTAPGRCARHVGQLAAHCAPCRSERLGAA